MFILLRRWGVASPCGQAGIFMTRRASCTLSRRIPFAAPKDCPSGAMM